jgi:hypothetical protein
MHTMTFFGLKPSGPAGARLTMKLESFILFGILSEHLCGRRHTLSLKDDKGYLRGSACRYLAWALQSRLDDGKIDAYLARKGYLGELRKSCEQMVRGYADELPPGQTLHGAAEELLDDEKWVMTRNDVEAMIEFLNTCGGIKSHRNTALA